MMPVLFLSHGGGPCWFLDGSKKEMSMAKEMDMNSKSADFMRNLRQNAGLPRSPEAILVVSAHWEEADFTVLTAEEPSLFFDYYGFPEHTYHLQWPVPGHPDAAKRVQELLNRAGFKCKTDLHRGLDHGVFVPLKLAYPEADVPVFQLSLKTGLSISEHLAVGEALKDLLFENILIIGSGQATHNLRESGASGEVPSWCSQFRDWFHDVLTNATYSAEERKRKIESSTLEKTFSKAHPRIEHFLPAVVASAASGYKPGKVLYEEIVCGSMLMSNIMFD